MNGKLRLLGIAMVFTIVDHTLHILTITLDIFYTELEWYQSSVRFGWRVLMDMIGQ